MPRINFRIDGLANEALRLRLRRHLEPGEVSDSAGLAQPAASVLSTKAILVAIALGGAVYSSSVSSKPAVLLDGKVFRGDRVLVLRDKSGSMDPWQVRLEGRLAALRAAGVTIDHVADADGSAVTDVVKALLLEIPNLPQVDTIYSFSDFKDYNDPEGFNQLRTLLSSRELKFYIASVNREPDQDWAEIARQSGGDVFLAGR